MLKSLTFSILTVFIFTLCGYAQKDRVEDRIAYARRVINKGLKDNDSVMIAEGYYLLAKRMLSINQPEEAYRLFYLSIKINEKLGDYAKIGRIYMRLADAELNQGNNHGAQEMLNEARSIFRKHNLPKEEEASLFLTEPTYSLYNDKRLYTNINPDSALLFLQKREKKIISSKNTMDLALVKFQIGTIYLYQKNKLAIPYLESAILTARNDPSLRLTIKYHLSLANAYILFNRLPDALNLLTESQKIIETGTNLLSASVALHYDTYAAYYAAVNDWQNAYICKDSASRYLHHLVENDRTGNISRWRVQLETEKKDLELRFQKQEIAVKQSLIEQQQLFMIIVAILLSGLAVISYFLYRNYKKQKRLSEKNAVLIHEQNHRVKNNLQVISSLLNLQNDYVRDDTSRQVLSESQSRIDAMALLHRQLYENDQVELINIENLFYDIIHSVGHTFGVTSLQLRLPLEVTLLSTDTATSLGLIMNELAINSFKYAFKHHEPVIEVSSRKNGNSIQIIYKDFGTTDLTGIFSSSEKKGFGLNLIDMILFQINGTLTYDFKNDSAITLSFVNA